MKLCCRLLLLLTIQFDDCENREIKKGLKQFAVEVVTKSFANHHSTASLIYSFEGRLNVDFTDSIVQTVSKESTILLTIESVENLQANKMSLKISSLIFVDTFSSFLKVLDKIIPNLFDFRGKYAIVLTNGKIGEINEIFKLLWIKQIHNVLVSYDDGLEVKVMTFFPFNSERCDDSTAVEINVTTLRINDLFANKFRDMKNFPIRVSGARNIPFVMMNKKKKVVGRDINLVEAIAKALNFKLDLKYIGYKMPFGIMFENGTSTGAIKDLLESQTDIIVSDFFLKHSRLGYMEASKTYFNTEIIFIVPPGRELKSIEKILYPFSTNFWILLTSFILITFIIIFLMKPEHRWTIFLSLLSIAFAVSLPSFPRKTSARWLLISFVMFCLVLQAVYQGSLFKIIQKNVKLKEVQSIDEIIEKDFKFYTIGSTDDLFTEHKRIIERKVVVSWEVFDEMMKKLRSSSFKGVIILSSNELLFMNQNRAFNFTYKACKENFVTVSIVMYFRKHFFLANVINDVISNLESGGFINYWHSSFIDKKFSQSEKIQNAPQQLTVAHMLGCFQLWAGGCTFAYLCFIVEFIIRIYHSRN